MNEKEIITQLQKASEMISADSSWKQAAKLSLIKELPGIPQNIKPPKNIARSMTRINPLHIAAIAVTTGALIVWAFFAMKSNKIPECEGANPPRIESIGTEVRVINSLIPLRAEPDAGSNNILTTLPEGTLLEVVGEPVCVPLGDGANLWWYVRTEDGMEGYAAEGSATTDTYYLETVE